MLSDIGFEIVLASPPKYNDLVAEIYFEGKFVLLINQEKGAGVFEVETPGCGLAESEVIRRVCLSGLLVAMQSACERLSGKANHRSD